MGAAFDKRGMTALLKTKTAERDEKSQSRDETKRRTGHKAQESGDGHLERMWICWDISSYSTVGEEADDIKS